MCARARPAVVSDRLGISSKWVGYMITLAVTFYSNTQGYKIVSSRPVAAPQEEGTERRTKERESVKPREERALES